MLQERAAADQAARQEEAKLEKEIDRVLDEAAERARAIKDDCDQVAQAGLDEIEKLVRKSAKVRGE